MSRQPREYFTPEEVQKEELDYMHGYQEITCHVIFDMKMDLTQKSKLVANGIKTYAPFSLT